MESVVNPDSFDTKEAFFISELQSAGDEAVHQSKQRFHSKCDYIFFYLVWLRVLQCHEDSKLLCKLLLMISVPSLCSDRGKNMQAAACLPGDLLPKVETTFFIVTLDHLTALEIPPRATK